MLDMNSDYGKKLMSIYKKYEKNISDAKTIDELLEFGAGLQKDVEKLNIEHRLWNESKGYDHDAIYYVAEYIVEHSSLVETYFQSGREPEEYKKMMAALLFKRIDQSGKVRIHAIEPHPDDVLGSASGLCYSDGAFVILHTMTRVIDDRESVCLEPDTIEQYKTVRKKPNIIKQEKYALEDLHWDERRMEMNISYAELAEDYIVKYDPESFERLVSSVSGIIGQAKEENAYVAFPLGIEHPMHILITYMCAEQIKKQKFDLKKVIIYVDHPYDYQNAGNGRLRKAKDYIQSELNLELCRCDDVSVDQSALREIITEIYGERHYGEFSGALENTFCSYFINDMALDEIQRFLKVHVNNILYITAQAKPFLKTGGLGEVAYVLCKELKDFVNDVRIMMPKYGGSRTDGDCYGIEKERFGFDYRGSNESDRDIFCEFEEREYDGLTYYLLDIEGYFDQKNSFDSKNNGRVVTLFCDAIMQGLNTINYVPSVLHCNDWQTALIPFLRKTKYNYYRPEMKVIYTIHFYGYKGIFNKKRVLEYAGLSEENCRLCISCSGRCPMKKIELLSDEDLNKLNATPSQMSCMKAGIEFADVVTTVSKGYAGEIQRYPDFANVKVVGIRNGISNRRYEFSKESGFVDIGSRNFLAAKRKNKDRLQKKLGLETDFHIPVICMVSRLNVVKGMEVVKNIIEEILELPAQMVIIGDDDKGTQYADQFREKEKEFSGKFAYRGFSEELEYQTYAGSDILLMPSLSEACGTTQINAMRYGVVPIVSTLEAFHDTVIDFKDRYLKGQPEYWGKGIGFYAYKDDCWVFLEVIKKAVEIYRNGDCTDTWNEIAEDCSKVDFSWKNGSIREYLELYNGLKN